MATASANTDGPGTFRRWRRARPFWGGLFQMLAGIELLLSGNLSLGAVSLHVGPTGFLSYVIPAMLFLCGLMSWLTPPTRLFYGILGSLVAVYSLIGVNFGGFFIGLLLGIVGGALTVAWSPRSPAPQLPAAGSPVGPPADDAESNWFLDENSNQQPRYDHGQPYNDAPTYGGAHAYGAHPQDEAPREVQHPERWWGTGANPGGGHPGSGYPGGPDEPPPPAGGGGQYRGRLLAITLVPATLAATMLFAVNHPGPAYSAPTTCPTPIDPSGVPSPKAPGTRAGTAKAPDPKAPDPKTGNAPSKASDPGTNNGSTPQKAATPNDTPTPAATSTGSGNPFVQGWNDFVDFWKNLLGGGDSSTPDPGTPDPTASPSPGTGTGGTSPKPVPSGSAKAADPGQPKAGEPSATPSTSASASTPPCPNVAKAAADPGQVLVSATSGRLTGNSLTMTWSKYQGVAELPTATGTVRVLKFEMDKSVTTAFQLAVNEPNGKTTVITSPSLTTQGNVKFYTPEFSGDLLGIRVNYTPDSPPPLPVGLPLPILWFTNVSIDLAFVQCDQLLTPNGPNGQPGLKVQEQ